MFKKINFYQILITIVAVILTSAAIVYGWTAPVGGPPGNDVAPPINIGSTAQTKLGGLILGTGLSFSQTALSIPIGNLAIGNSIATIKPGRGGFLDVNDVWIRDAMKWASDLGGGSGGFSYYNKASNVTSAGNAEVTLWSNSVSGMPAGKYIVILTANVGGTNVGDYKTKIDNVAYNYGRIRYGIVEMQTNDQYIASFIVDLTGGNHTFNLTGYSEGLGWTVYAFERHLSVVQISGGGGGGGVDWSNPVNYSQNMLGVGVNPFITPIAYKVCFLRRAGHDGTPTTCDVSRETNGTWRLQAESAGPYVSCNMYCFN